MLLLWSCISLFLFAEVSCTNNSAVACEPGEIGDCSKCYAFLVEQVTQHDRNYFEIQNTFFPPNGPSPVFVIVTYHFRDYPGGDEMTEIWFWSTSAFYIWQPLHVLQFTSLFFSETKLQSANATLTLPLKCRHANDSYRKLLTQRLKAYALLRSVATPIVNAYEAETETVAGLKKWHEDHGTHSVYTFSTFFVFPIVSWVFLLGIFLYMNKYQPEPRIKKLTSILKGSDHRKSWECKLQLQNEFTLSLIFVLFSVALSSSAVSFANLSQKKLHAEIDKYYTNKAGEYLWYIYSLIYVLIAQDAFILCAMIIGGLYSIGIALCLDLTEIPSVEQSVKNLEAQANILKGELDGKLKTEAEHLVIATVNLKKELKHIVKPSRQESDWVLETVVLFRRNRIGLLNIALEKLKSMAETLEKLKNLTESIKNVADLSTIPPERKNDLVTKLENLLGIIELEQLQQQINLMEKARDALKEISSARNLSTDLANLVEVVSQGIYTDYFSRCNGDWCTVEADLNNLRLIQDPGELNRSVQHIITRVEKFSSTRADITNLLEAMSDAATAIKRRAAHFEFFPVENNLHSAKLCLGAAELSLVTLVSADVEILSLSSLNTLIEVESYLIAAVDTLPSRTGLSSEECRIEKLNCSLNLIKAANNLITVAITLATYETDLDRNAPKWKTMALSLIVAATKLATSIPYLIHNGPEDVEDDLQKMQEAASKLTSTIQKTNREASLPEISMPRGKLWIPLWEFCTYSMLFPLCIVLNHLNYIIIAFINNLYHATGVAVAYGIIIVFNYVTLDRIPHILCLNHSWKQGKGWYLVLLQVLKIGILVFLSGYVTVDIILYFFIPIENAFDDAANHFISIYQTTIVFFTALFLYFIYNMPSKTTMRTFARAADRLFYKHKKNSVLHIARGDWVKLGDNEKEVELAKGLLKKIN